MPEAIEIPRRKTKKTNTSLAKVKVGCELEFHVFNDGWLFVCASPNTCSMPYIEIHPFR